MTKEDIVAFELMKQNFIPPNDSFQEVPLQSVICLPTNNSDTTIISELTEQQTNQSERIISLNYSSGNSAMVLDTLVGAQDWHQARERNRSLKEQGGKVADTYKKAKAVTAMYHFNSFGCKIGKTALEKKTELFNFQQQKILAARKKEEAAYKERRKKYDDVMKLGIDDEKLTGTQLRVLLNMKKRKTDNPITSLKKKELFTLWKEWKARPFLNLL
jgi:hypothetical protein